MNWILPIGHLGANKRLIEQMRDQAQTPETATRSKRTATTGDFKEMLLNSKQGLAIHR